MMDYQTIMRKTAEAKQVVQEVLEEVKEFSPEDVIVLEAKFVNNLFGEVLQALEMAGKLILSDSYEERCNGIIKYRYAAGLLAIIEKECRQIKVSLPLVA
ncbi:MAG: hypothetical protein IJ809_00045 [Clostridia bacterium]|nr:hypothetical protein [Clostridia bacterium]